MVAPTDPGTVTTTFAIGDVEVAVALDAGPRIVGYARPNGPDLFARLQDEVIEHPAVGTFSFIGGHRLWRSPEMPEVTYQPDAAAVAVDHLDEGIQVSGIGDRDGIVKVITLRGRGRFTVVDHTLRNDGWRPVRCAAWGITQLAPGGVAVLPHSREPIDTDGVLPNQSISVWPYTDLSAPEVEFRSDSIRVAASRGHTKFKIGQENRRGWIAYRLGDELFVKWSMLHQDDSVYPDLGSSVECYRDHRFLELETLGPLTDLQPGGELSHREVWMLVDLEGEPMDDVLGSLPPEPPMEIS